MKSRIRKVSYYVTTKESYLVATLQGEIEDTCLESFGADTLELKSGLWVVRSGRSGACASSSVRDIFSLLNSCCPMLRSGVYWV